MKEPQEQEPDEGRSAASPPATEPGVEPQRPAGSVPAARDTEAAGVPESYDFDIFISYATDPDYKLARELKSFIETFHRLPTPENLRLRPLRVCVDGSDFHKSARAGGEVGAIIEDYLARSKALLVLCSKNARRSPWIAQELSFFLGRPGPAAVILAVTEGADLNDPGVYPPAAVEAGLHKRIAYDFRGAHGRALPDWRSVRDYDDERTRLAANLYDKPAGEIQPIWFREQRRQARNKKRIIVAAVVIALALIATIVYFYLNAEKNALAEAERARQTYVANINSASRAIAEGTTPVARQLLDALLPSQGQEDLRDFEWWYLSRRAGAEKSRLFMKDITFQTVSVSADGSLVAAAGESGVPQPADPSRQEERPQSIYVWSLAGGELRILRGHSGAVKALKFSPSAGVLVSGGEDGLKVWDAATGAELRSVKLWSVEGLAFSPDGRTLAAGHGASFTLLDTATWEKSGELAAYPDQEVNSFAFSPDGRLLVGGGMEKKVHLWDVARRKEVKVLGEHADRVTAAAWSARANLLATGDVSGEVVLWDMGEQKELARLPQGDGARSLAFSPDGKLLAVGLGDPLEPGSGKAIRLWDVATRTPRGLLTGHAGRVEALEFGPSGGALYSTGEEENVFVWDVPAACALTFFEGHELPVWSL
ncbi:MAG TPA: TIR domain-containing protein, partial [Pyrinomonadaceae bacterium]|nr:TIR domain-containing protein [Pyrinomonadaceae bacterium]